MADEPKKPTYTPLPDVPKEVQERYQVLLEVLAGKETVSGGARRLQLSRNHFQSLLHRGLEGLLEGLSPKPSGRPAKPEREVQLESELERLRRENEKLQARVETVDRLLGVASGLMRGRIQPTPKSRRPKAHRGEDEGDAEKDEPDGWARVRLRGVEAMRALGLTPGLAAAIAGVSRATVSRWRGRRRRGGCLVYPRGPRSQRPSSPGLLAEVERWVRQLHGQVGAECLQRLVPGVSRRQAARVKHATLTALERERVEAAVRVTVACPGVIRGFDAVHVRTTVGRAYVLPSADAAVPYRTSVAVSPTYDGDSVARALDEDVGRNGAPLVWRVDRASVHRCPQVRELLESHGILVLHGPPRHPRYYGQLERMNRDHRGWLAALGPLDLELLAEEAHRMLAALNAAVPRRSLGWRTAGEVWRERPVLTIDRSGFLEDVRERTAQLALSQPGLTAYDGLVDRLAIEGALTSRGLLKCERGGWC
jgi:transposase